MPKFDVRVDVSDGVGSGEHIELAATIVTPSPGQPHRATIALFGLPGGVATARAVEPRLR